MDNQRSRLRRKISTVLLTGLALTALGGCYPYYYDFHYSHGDGHYNRGHHGKHYYDGGHYYHRRDRLRRERRHRYKYYRHH